MSIFMDPCIFKGRPRLIGTISIFVYFGYILGFINLGIAYFRDNCPITYVCLTIFVKTFFVVTGFRLALINFDKTILKNVMLRKKLRNAFPQSHALIKEIRYPYTMALQSISDRIAPESTYSWRLLTPQYNQNLANVIPSFD